jgi:hypothetical protein
MTAAVARHGFNVEAVFSDAAGRFCDLLATPCSS